MEEICFQALLLSRRKILGLTQTALAKSVGVQQSTVSAWETGRQFPGEDSLPDLAIALGVRPEELRKIIEASALPSALPNRENWLRHHHSLMGREKDRPSAVWIIGCVSPLSHLLNNEVRRLWSEDVRSGVLCNFLWDMRLHTPVEFLEGLEVAASLVGHPREYVGGTIRHWAVAGESEEEGETERLFQKATTESLRGHEFIGPLRCGPDLVREVRRQESGIVRCVHYEFPSIVYLPQTVLQVVGLDPRYHLGGESFHWLTDQDALQVASTIRHLERLREKLPNTSGR